MIYYYYSSYYYWHNQIDNTQKYYFFFMTNEICSFKRVMEPMQIHRIMHRIMVIK